MVLAQEIPKMALLEMEEGVLQEVVGVLDVITLPELSTARHRVVLGQVMLLMAVVWSMSAGDDQEAATVGLVEVTTLPAPSTATQRDADGQEMPKKVLPGSAWTSGVQVGGLAPGFEETNISPNASTATHRDVLGQDTPVRPEFHDESMVVTFHAEEPPVGVVDVTTLPSLSTATQSEAEGQASALKISGSALSIRT